MADGIFRVIPRSADLLITWRGGSAGSLVVMSGVSVAENQSGIIYVANSVSGSHFDAAGLDLGMIEFTNTTIRLAAYR